jgi:uncharacterized membrane protein YczE
LASRIRGFMLRLLWLNSGLVGFGLSLALMVKARLGLDPWDVLHQGIARHLGIQIGWVVIAVSVLVLVAWIPLRQCPGIGTLCNAVVVGLVVNLALAVVPAPQSYALRLTDLAVAIFLNGIATGCYIGAGLGPGPRDGLMTAFARQGPSIRRVRTSIEVTVLFVGLMLGGSVGIGTFAYAASIGPLVHYFLPRLSLAPKWPQSSINTGAV